MIGVLIPAHNEQALIAHCLHAVLSASRHPQLKAEPVRVLVVLDSCDDLSADIAAQYDVDVLAINARNVGAARGAGAQWLLERGARWISCTDADSRVAEDWLVAQLALGKDAVCGTVTVEDWGSAIDEAARARYQAAYQARDGHRHIHGANLGFSANAYRRAGGFQPLACHEDVHLVKQLEACGASIAWSHRPQVITSARLDCRAAGGFGDYLRSLLSVAEHDQHQAGSRPDAL
ncbi:glycosyltransferase [Pseudomonas lundensis]|uniref:glycosyltransferase n=1 Tax=Pseudomonas lundensis TaxID=86185 RepID=UPI00065488DF|nr:glycosyltransferase [Pseudomonas lundensis]KMM91278.1 glycosyl transferase [Pseudomonas lundensis]OZY31764.1 glycosyl transferase [Pseudomonas lundensis]